MVNLRSFEVPTVVKHAPGAVECLADQVKALGMSAPNARHRPGAGQGGHR